MRPHCNHILDKVANSLKSTYMQMLNNEHATAEMGLTVNIIRVVSEEFDRAVHRRVEENRELRKIFSEALEIVKKDDLKHRLKAAVETTEDDFRVSALDKMNCELRKVFIDLHAYVETLEGEAARHMEKLIWQEMEKEVKRRELEAWFID